VSGVDWTSMGDFLARVLGFGWPVLLGLGVFAIVYKHGWPWRKNQ